MHIRFFVIRRKAHPQILLTDRVERGSTFVRFRTYHRLGYLSLHQCQRFCHSYGSSEQHCA